MKQSIPPVQIQFDKMDHIKPGAFVSTIHYTERDSYETIACWTNGDWSAPRQRFNRADALQAHGQMMYDMEHGKVEPHHPNYLED